MSCKFNAVHKIEDIAQHNNMSGVIVVKTLASVKYSQLDGNVILAHEFALCKF